VRPTAALGLTEVIASPEVCYFRVGCTLLLHPRAIQEKAPPVGAGLEFSAGRPSGGWTARLTDVVTSCENVLSLRLSVLLD
jgi:hypothetical protein